MTASLPPGFVVIANGAAGSVDERSLAAATLELAHHAPTTVCHTESPDDVDDAIRSLDGRRPVVVGGDGSLHLAVNRMVALGAGDVPLGLVPLGTGNDLARGAGLPLDPISAARTAATGRPTPLAAASVSGYDDVVVNNAHLGLGTQAAETAIGLKPRLGPLAYLAGTVAAGVRPDTLDVVIDVDGERCYAGEVIASMLALGPSAGGGHELAPSAEPTDPTIEVVAIAPAGAGRRLGLALDVLRGRDPARRPEVGRWNGAVIRVEVLSGEGHTRRWDVDGELVPWDREVEVRVQPGLWHLVMPQE